MSYENIRYEVAQNGVATVTLDDPDTRNAPGNQTLDELITAFEAARDDEAGHVLAGALGLALACDLIVASEEAGFATPEINVGVFPFMIMALVYRNVGRKQANEMLLLGERMTAAQAHAAGIVNKVVPAAGLDAAVSDWAEELAAKSPLMMRLGKDAMFRQMDMPLLDALDYLHHNLTLALSTDDAVEGVTAFFEQRDPVWSGR